MSKDPARKWTDKELKEMSYHIGQIYEQATDEITEKWDAYMARAAKRLDKLHNDYVTAPDDEKEEALKKYQKALENVTFKDKYYKDMVLETTTRLCNTNKIATAYMNGEMPKIYRVNYDQIDPMAVIPGIRYDMVSEETVAHLIKDGTIPQREIDEKKDKTWNTKQIGSSVLQGIIQGESIKDIAKRLMPIVDKNEASAVRNARTMTTCAENRGRLDRYADYESKGLVMAKVWIATGDNRTRDWHLSMDGQEVSKDEEFTDGQGNKLMYPGDPDAEPQTTWNCRCSMRSHILGVRGKDGEITPIPDMHESGLHQEQIEKERERRDMEEREKQDNIPRNKNGEEIIFNLSERYEKSIEILKDLIMEYNTRLKEVTSGAKMAAGDVDSFLGQTMRLNSTKPSNAVHEFAHSLATTDAEKYGLSHDAEFWKEIRKVNREYKKAVYEDYNKTITAYANSNDIDEFMAEAFAQAKCVEMGIPLPDYYGDDYTYAFKVLEIIDKYFKKR